MTAVVQRIISQRVIGYNLSRRETVIESVCLMSDGTTGIDYTGYRTDDNGMESVWQYGTRRPYVEQPQEVQP